jgi:hypothetical protein
MSQFEKLFKEDSIDNSIEFFFTKLDQSRESEAYLREFIFNLFSFFRKTNRTNSKLDFSTNTNNKIYKLCGINEGDRCVIKEIAKKYYNKVSYGSSVYYFKTNSFYFIFGFNSKKIKELVYNENIHALYNITYNKSSSDMIIFQYLGDQNGFATYLRENSFREWNDNTQQSENANLNVNESYSNVSNKRPSTNYSFEYSPNNKKIHEVSEQTYSNGAFTNASRSALTQPIERKNVNNNTNNTNNTITSSPKFDAGESTGNTKLDEILIVNGLQVEVKLNLIENQALHEELYNMYTRFTKLGDYIKPDFHYDSNRYTSACQITFNEYVWRDRYVEEVGKIFNSK